MSPFPNPKGQVTDKAPTTLIPNEGLDSDKTSQINSSLGTNSDKGIAYVWPGAGPGEIVYEVWGKAGILYETENEKIALEIVNYFNNRLRLKYWDFIPLKGFGNKLMLGSRAK